MMGRVEGRKRGPERFLSGDLTPGDAQSSRNDGVYIRDNVTEATDG